MSNANDILMSGGGKFAQFQNIGDACEGTITQIGDPYQTREFNTATQKCDGPPRFTKAGKPVMAFHLTVQTTQRNDDEDDGLRVIDVNSWRIQNAVRDAVRASGAQGIDVGGYIKVTFTATEKPGDRRSGMLWAAEYRPGNAANTVLMGDAQPAAPAAQATPQPAAQAAPTLPGSTPPPPPGVTPEAWAAWLASQGPNAA